MTSPLRYAKLLLFLLPLAFLGVFFVYPVLALFDVSLRPDGALDLSAFARLLTSDYYLDTLLFHDLPSAGLDPVYAAAGAPLRLCIRALPVSGQVAAAVAGDFAFCAAHSRGCAGVRCRARRTRAGE